MPASKQVTAPFLFLAAVAICLGVYGRLKGLGFAPVSPDEYYLARGVDGILKYGLPAFDCGGYYQRGLGMQYLIAGLRWAGLSIELASRIVCAVSSIALFPAVYLLGQRLVSRNLALIVVAVVALSIWQIELARFGRMYAPFHAIFTWYLVFFLRYVVDRDTRAMVPMMALTFVGAFVWEGSVFLALANFFPPRNFVHRIAATVAIGRGPCWDGIAVHCSSAAINWQR